MGRNYHFHALTLAQVPSLLRVDGTWPGPISLRAGWMRARARPWNETISDPMVRLDRGGAEFLIAVVNRLRELGAVDVYSPALYAGSTRVWRRSGFEDYASLDVMERGFTDGAGPDESAPVAEVSSPNWEEILEVDRSAFEGFWGMNRLGLEEAVEASRAGAVLVTNSTDRLTGYAIVGSQWGTVYLHRIAVRPDETRAGLGSALLAAAIAWGERSGGRSMVLNVRPENEPARRLYARHGFTDTGTTLQVLRHRAR